MREIPLVVQEDSSELGKVNEAYTPYANDGVEALPPKKDLQAPNSSPQEVNDTCSQISLDREPGGWLAVINS